MTLGSVLEDRVVPREQHCSELAGCGHDESINRVTVEDSGKTGAADPCAAFHQPHTDVSVEKDGPIHAPPPNLRP
jgi:hypothetical protein